MLFVIHFIFSIHSLFEPRVAVLVQHEDDPVGGGDARFLVRFLLGHLVGLRFQRRRCLVGVGKLVAFRYLLGLVHNVANIKSEVQKQSRMSKYIKVRKAACGILKL